MPKQALGRKVWYDPDSQGYIGLDLTNNVPTQVQRVIEGIDLLPKGEYHCSLVAVRRYIDDRAQEQSIADAIKDFLQIHDLRFVGLGDERYYCRENGQATLIAPVSIKGIDEFKAFVRTLIPEYQPPFSHVTLLKSEATRYGIGIHSIRELTCYCTRVE